MEQYGFARSGVPGEYSPYIASVALASDVTVAGAYTEILSKSVTIETVGEVLTVVFSATSREALGAGGGVFQIKIDGASVIQTSACGKRGVES